MSKKSKSEPILLVAVEIETSGCRPSRHNLLAIGICAMTLDGTLILKKRISMVPAKIEYEEHCYESFWKDKQDIIQALRRESVSLFEGMKRFADILDNFDDAFCVVLLSDNPTFDVAWIDYHFDVVLARRPVAYVKGEPNVYRPLLDTESYARGLLKMEDSSEWVLNEEFQQKFKIQMPASIIHNHFPENDAHYICEFYRQLKIKIK